VLMTVINSDCLAMAPGAALQRKSTFLVGVYT
jgi:hypothetical protein